MGDQLFLSVLRWGGVGVGAVQVEGWWWWREYGLLLHFRVYYCACEKTQLWLLSLREILTGITLPRKQYTTVEL